MLYSPTCVSFSTVSFNFNPKQLFLDDMQTISKSSCHDQKANGRFQQSDRHSIAVPASVDKRS